jgi:hypothetical protein
MPRQPYAPVYSKEKPVYGPGQALMMPKIAEAVGQCIMVWAYVDWQMAILLAAMMKANSKASIAIFLTLKNARAQREVLEAAATMTLSESDKELFDAIMLIYGGLQSQRADIVHGLFGRTEAYENGMPWIEAKNLSKQWIERFHHQRTVGGMLSDAIADLESDKRLLQRSAFYRLDDLKNLQEEFLGLWRAVFHFYLAVQHNESPEDGEQRSLLLALPQMKRALARLRKPPPPPPQ